MASVLGLVKRIYTAFHPPASISTESQPIKFGILGAAAIAPPALIGPASNHPEAIVYAVAARDEGRATAYAKKHGIPKVYGGANGYQELLNDPEVDAIYNPLPNGLHYEWTMKALAAGKHVLLEKPSADTAEETRLMFELAERKGLVLLEAFHYRFHPAIQRVKVIIDSGELGAIKSIETNLAIPKGLIKDGDIRYDYSLGGGALMDMGCYTLNCIRYLSGSNPVEVLSASYEGYKPPSAPLDFTPNVDRRTTATLSLPNNVIATLTCDLGIPYRYGIIPNMPQINAIVRCEGGDIELFNFVMPTLYHSITVQSKDGTGGVKTRTEKVYKFAELQEPDMNDEEWWTTYRYQLEAFINKLKDRKPQTWLDKEDSVANIEWIEKIYAKGGLGSRPKSTYVP
ncbi:hypothetical protein BDQ12DRAFT_734614 [Crucibulum laeve]|uniref:D-xylose 1-dehydrogenase (NADP(+), D-xylono-1,5-lactone-forming) n=1 Tax=Crucibulum laeve TaxID=68775 RepID=A0A5C3M3U9_9AGAR|nr:hypothetical protein BDQ12DRAFT_734614 [Crucibulum laeve]